MLRRSKQEAKKVSSQHTLPSDARGTFGSCAVLPFYKSCFKVSGRRQFEVAKVLWGYNLHTVSHFTMTMRDYKTRHRRLFFFRPRLQT